MIEINQKLEHGDFFQGENLEEYRLLLKLSTSVYPGVQKRPELCIPDGLVCIHGPLMYRIPEGSMFYGENEYTFFDFHKLWINTYGDIWTMGKRL